MKYDTQPIADLMEKAMCKLQALHTMPKESRTMAIKIVNKINEEFHLDLKTVDSSAMTDSIVKLLEGHGAIKIGGRVLIRAGVTKNLRTEGAFDDGEIIDGMQGTVINDYSNISKPHYEIRLPGNRVLGIFVDDVELI